MNNTTPQENGQRDSALRHVTLGKGCVYFLQRSGLPNGGAWRMSNKEVVGRVVSGPCIFNMGMGWEYDVELASGERAWFPHSSVHTVKVTLPPRNA
jgi:hypothetical protein